MRQDFGVTTVPGRHHGSTICYRDLFWGSKMRPNHTPGPLFVDCAKQFHLILPPNGQANLRRRTRCTVLLNDQTSAGQCAALYHARRNGSQSSSSGAEALGLLDNSAGIRESGRKPADGRNDILGAGVTGLFTEPRGLVNHNHACQTRQERKLVTRQN
jgi:hypothetical protein